MVVEVIIFFSVRELKTKYNTNTDILIISVQEEIVLDNYTNNYVIYYHGNLTFFCLAGLRSNPSGIILILTENKSYQE